MQHLEHFIHCSFRLALQDLLRALKAEASALQVIHSKLRINVQFLGAEEQALKAMIRREVRRLKGNSGASVTSDGGKRIGPRKAAGADVQGSGGAPAVVLNAETGGAAAAAMFVPSDTLRTATGQDDDSPGQHGMDG